MWQWTKSVTAIRIAEAADYSGRCQVSSPETKLRVTAETWLWRSMSLRILALRVTKIKIFSWLAMASHCSGQIRQSFNLRLHWYVKFIWRFVILWRIDKLDIWIIIEPSDDDKIYFDSITILNKNVFMHFFNRKLIVIHNILLIFYYPAK